MKLKTAALVACSLAFTWPLAMAQNSNQGVSANEIVLGSILDLSGPVAALGKQARMGMTMAIDEINEQGGVNGRKLRLVVEDSAYDPKRAVLAAQKLVNQDKIFAMIGHIGAAHNLAAMPVQFQKNVLNFLPNTGAREMYEPLHRLKYSFFVPYFLQISGTLPALVKKKGVQKVCALYQDDDLGLEVLQGGEAGLKTIGMTYSDKTSYKRGATDFSSQIARLKSSGCELIVLGTLVRETVGAVTTAKRIDYNPIFLAPNTAYTDLIHKLGGPAMNGLYATMTVQHPYLDAASQQVRFWANKYKTAFNEDPGTASIYGYVIVDTFVKAATKAGPNLTTDTFIRAMDSMSIPPDIFGSAPASYSATKRLGSEASRLSQIVDGRWQVVSEYPK